MSGVIADAALRLSYELENITERGEFLRAASKSLAALLPADQLNWLAFDVPAGKAELHGVGGVDWPETVQALARVVGAHPLWMAYSGHPGDMSPLRMSDLIPPRAWRSHPVYAEVFRPLGAVYQVGIAVTPYQEGTGTGWGLNRTRSDFTDEEMVTAALLQPILIALNQASIRAFGSEGSGTKDVASRRAEAADRASLTLRERRVLELLATGLTATAIGHVCRISPQTVRKHLENIYAKLGCHDRLMAVRRAAELGLVAMPGS